MSDITGILVANALGQRRDRENAERQIQQEVAMTMLQSLVTGLKSARTPKQVKTTYNLFNGQFKKLSGIDLYNANDLENIERLVGMESSIASRLAESTAKQVGGILTGETTFDQAMAALNSDIDGLSQEFGEAEVDPFTAETHTALARAIERKQTFDSGRQQLQAALRPQTQAAYNFLPQLSPLIIRFEENLDAVALTALTQAKFGPGVRPDMGVLRSHWQQTGAEWLGLAGTREGVIELDDDQKAASVRAGEALWTAEKNNYIADISEEFYDQMLPGLMNVGEAQFEQLINLQVDIANQAVKGEDLFEHIDLDMAPIFERISQLREKYERGTATEMDERRVARTVDGVRASKLLDVSGTNFSGMTDDQFDAAFREGRVEGALRQVAGPDGGSLYDLLFDESDLVRPFADTMLLLDHDKLANGDAQTWDLANYLASDRDPSAYRYVDPGSGAERGIWGALFASEEKDAESIQRRAVSSAFVQHMGRTPSEFLFGGVAGDPLVEGGQAFMAGQLSRAKGGAEARVEDAIAAMDEATLHAINTGDTEGVAEILDGLFKTPGTPPLERDRALADMVESFSSGFDQEQSMEQRLSGLRSSITKNALIPVIDTSEDKGKAGGAIGDATEKKQKEATAARIRETADISSAKTRVSDIRTIRNQVPSISTGPIGLGSATGEELTL